MAKFMDEKEIKKQKMMNFAVNSVELISNNYKSRNITKKDVKALMSKPQENCQKLQDLSSLLMGTNGNYSRLVRYWGGMATFDHIIFPLDNKKNNNKELYKSYLEACSYVQKMNIKYNCKWFGERLIEKGELFIYKIEDNKGIIYLEIPNSICKIDRIKNGMLLYSINLQKINEKMLAGLPMEFQEAYLISKNNKNNKDNWYQVSDKGVAFNLMGYTEHGYPLLTFLFDKIVSVEESENKRDNLEEIENLKLIHQKIPIDSKTGEVLIDEDEVRLYHEATKNNLPKGVAIATNPLDMNSVSLQTNNNNNSQGVDSVSKALKSVYDSAGVNIQLFNAEKCTAEIVKKGIVADELLVYKIVQMFQNYFNQDLKNKKIKGYYWQVKILEVTYFNREEAVKTAKDNLAYGGSRMSFMALNGFTPLESVSILQAEQNLGFDKLLKPQQSAHTMSNKDKEENSNKNNNTKNKEENEELEETEEL